MRKIYKVKFKVGTVRIYLSTAEFAVGDTVLVPTRKGLEIATVEEECDNVPDFLADENMKYIMGAAKLNEEPESDEEYKKERSKELYRQMLEIIDNREDLLFELVAMVDYDFAKLYARYKTIKNELDEAAEVEDEDRSDEEDEERRDDEEELEKVLKRIVPVLTLLIKK